MFIENFKIPNTVRISSRLRYRVLWIDAFEDPKQLGECDSKAKQIIIKKGLDPVLEFFVFYHEMIHAISFHKGLDLSEFQVNTIETSFHKISKLNDWL